MTQEMSQHAVLSSRSRGQKRVSKTCIARCTARECAVNSDLSIATNLLAAHSNSSVDKMQLSLAADDQVSGLAPLLTWRNRWYALVACSGTMHCTPSIMGIFRHLCDEYYQCRNGQSGPDYAPIPPPPHPTYDLDAVRLPKLCL